MPINEIEEKIEFDVVGTIRLGIKEPGKTNPKDVPHFVMHDAKIAIPYYGEKPTELDGMFVSEDNDVSFSTYYRWFSAGRIGPDGKGIPGRLNCQGNGPRTSVVDGELVESPGEATYFKGREMPGPDDVVFAPPPKRPCLGRSCPDYFDEAGNQRCRQTMRAVFMIPLATRIGVFKLTTSHWSAIKSFHNQIALIKAQNNGSYSFFPLKFIREPETKDRFDKKKQTRAMTTHWPVKIRDNPDFLLQHGDKLRRILSMKHMPITIAAAPTALLEAGGIEDHYPMLQEGEALGKDGSIIPVKVVNAQELLLDSEVVAGFEKIERLTGKPFSEKNRLIVVRKREQEPDIKAAVLKSIAERLEALAASAQKAEPQSIPKPETPEESSGGIL
ncbi:MAG: hypothetical protein MUP21_01260 [Dehalococcoidia bacterium]|nr:hypothetical protein [Dehalococcoidia bacterium]